MKTGDTGLNLIKAYEGLRMSAHFTQKDEWVVGYGHRATAQHGTTVSEGDALDLLKDDISPMEKVLADNVRAPLNQNEHDALISLMFNIGEENFLRSTVLRKLNSGDKLGAANAFEMWNKAYINGEFVTVDGLVRRRAAEKSLFLMPTDSSLVVPTADLSPSPQCDGEILPENLPDAPLMDFDDFRDKQMAHLSEEENNARLRSLFAATQSLGGDPSKMIISKAEERADIGVTIGALMAGLLALMMTVLGFLLMFGDQYPQLANTLGLSPVRMAQIFEDLPLWIMAFGLGMTYFVLYILVKRSTRHGLKKRRARELSRIQVYRDK